MVGRNIRSQKTTMTVLAVTMVIMVMRRNGGRYQIRHFSRLRCNDCAPMSRKITRDKNQRASGRSLLSVPQISAEWWWRALLIMKMSMLVLTTIATSSQSLAQGQQTLLILLTARDIIIIIIVITILSIFAKLVTWGTLMTVKLTGGSAESSDHFAECWHREEGKWDIFEIFSNFTNTFPNMY